MRLPTVVLAVLILASGAAFAPPAYSADAVTETDKVTEPDTATEPDTVTETDAVTERDTATESDTLTGAERLIDAGRYGESEAMLKRIIGAGPEDARAHQLLGDTYKRQSRFDEALGEYDSAIELGGANAELYKSIASINKWTGNSPGAAAALRKALEINPDDREARADLGDITRSNGLDVSVMTGGWEPDYTTSAYEVMLAYRGVKNLDLYAGYGFADQQYYDRTKLYAKAYYYYKPGDYFKVNPQYKDYDYPLAKIPTPDSNSYDKVPSIELEVQHWYRDNLRANFIYEYSHPSFFHDKDSSVTNHKFTGELYYITSYRYLRLKGIVALLRDPDPDTTTIINRTCLARDGLGNCTSFAAATNVDYQVQTLVGGAVEYSRDRWEAELKYMPNRDLDSSYQYSLLAFLSYDFSDSLTGRFDTVHDKYSSQSNYSGSTANVLMVSGRYKVTPELDIGAGLKYLDLPSGTDNTGFISFTYKTGIGF